MNLAYLAGFFDGEGCINFSRNARGGGIFPRILIVNTNKEILEEIKHQFGGDIAPLSLRKSNWKQGYQLRISWTAAVDFISAVYRHLRVKRLQADTVLAWHAIRPGPGWHRLDKQLVAERKDACNLLIRRMHWLNAKGNSETDDPIKEFLP